MKKIILVLAVALCLAIPSLAHSQCQSLGEMTASGVALTHGGTLCSLLVRGASADCTITAYDSATTATGTKLAYADLPAGVLLGGFSGYSTVFTTGLYIAISGTGCVVIPSAR